MSEEISVLSSPESADVLRAENLTRESDHRIANNLSLIASMIRLEAGRLPAAPIPAADVRALLASLSARIETIARVHQLVRHGDGAAEVDLAAYVRQVGEATVASAGGADTFDIDFDLPRDHVIAAKQATIVGLIVCEAIVNSLKYAHPTGIRGKIWISARATPNAFQISVSDDGVGLPENFDPKIAKTTGFVVMNALAGQIGGAIGSESSALGLSLWLDLPRANMRAG